MCTCTFGGCHDAARHFYSYDLLDSLGLGLFCFRLEFTKNTLGVLCSLFNGMCTNTPSIFSGVSQHRCLRLSTNVSIWYIDQTSIICVEHTLHWSHNGHDSVSNHQPHHCLLNRLFRRRSTKTSKLRVTGLCAGKFPTQMASNAENTSIWWRHHVYVPCSNDLTHYIILSVNHCMFTNIAMAFVRKGAIDNRSALVHVMAWPQTGAKPSSEPMMAQIIEAYMRHQASVI